MFALTRRALLGGLAGAPFVFAGQAVLAQMKPPLEGAVILTIAGDISGANRGASDPERDGFFKYHDIVFDRAFAFDLAALEALPVTQIRCQPPQYSASATFSGPLLRDVLKAVGGEGAAIETRALDGFSVELTAQQVADHEWILATRSDGRPLGLGGLGPLWLIYRPAAEKVTGEEEQLWPWALFFMRLSK